MSCAPFNKPALNPYTLHPLIENRWSPVAFEADPIPQAAICSILEAARWAPSCFNEQPWRFIVGDRQVSPEAHSLIAETLVTGNDWAKVAPLLVMSVAKRLFTYNNQPNRHASHDVGLAVENMIIQAMSLRIYSHQMAGFDVEKAHQLLNIPADYEPMAVIAFGYPKAFEAIDDPQLKERSLSPRSRKPMQDWVYGAGWEQPFPVCFT